MKTYKYLLPSAPSMQSKLVPLGLQKPEWEDRCNGGSEVKLSGLKMASSGIGSRNKIRSDRVR
jgi:hypothetical protein